MQQYILQLFILVLVLRNITVLSSTAKLQRNLSYKYVWEFTELNNAQSMLGLIKPKMRVQVLERVTSFSDHLDLFLTSSLNKGQMLLRCIFADTTIFSYKSVKHVYHIY